MNDEPFQSTAKLTSVHRTYCRNCPAACGLTVEMAENSIVSIQGDRDHPLSAGYLCTKGLMSAAWHNGEDRLVEVLRRGPSGAQAPVALAEALDEIAAKVSSILANHGPRAVALYHGTGAKMNTLTPMAIKAWLDAIGSPYLYSSSTIDQSAKWITAARMGVFKTGKPAIPDVDTMLVVGANPPVSHAGLPNKPFPANNPQKAIREARRRGAKLIVIDPRRTELARNADLHLQVFPGEDVPLLAAMINVILSNGWHDSAFCERFVTSLDRLAASVREFTPEYAAARARVPAEQIVEAASLFACSQRRSASSGTGLDMSPRSNLGEHLLETLNAICGAYRRVGDKVANAGGWRPRSRVTEGVQPPRRIWEEGPPLWTQPSGMVGGGEYPTSRLPDEILSGGVRALLVVGGNPAMALGQPAKTLAALRELDLLVTLDPRLTETAQLSHFVLPTSLPYERYDATHFLDAFFPRSFVQIAKPLLERPDSVLDDWEIIWELARRMGVQLVMREHVFGASGSGGDALHVDMETRPNSEELLRWVCRAGPAFEEILNEPRGRALATAPLIVQPADNDDGARLDVCPEDVAEELSQALADAADERFSHRLAVRRFVETMNTAFREAGRTQERWPTNPAFMNPGDMAELGIEEGAEIELQSDAGAVRCVAEADPTVRPGVVSIAALFGTADRERDAGGARGAFTGHLVSLDRGLEGINFMPTQSGIPLNIQVVGPSDLKEGTLN